MQVVHTGEECSTLSLIALAQLLVGIDSFTIFIFNWTKLIKFKLLLAWLVACFADARRVVRWDWVNNFIGASHLYFGILSQVKTWSIIGLEYNYIRTVGPCCIYRFWYKRVIVSVTYLCFLIKHIVFILKAEDLGKRTVHLIEYFHISLMFIIINKLMPDIKNNSSKYICINPCKKASAV